MRGRMWTRCKLRFRSWVFGSYSKEGQMLKGCESVDDAFDVRVFVVEMW